MKKHHKIAVKHLPPRVVKQPIREQIRNHRQHIERITCIFIFIALAVVILSGLPEWTGKATVATTVNITQRVEVNCSIPLQPGLNVISMNCISNAQDRDEVLNNTDITRIQAVYEYRNKQTDQWHVYNPNLPSYVIQDLSTFSRLKGYLFYISSNSTIIDYSGTLATSSDIPVFPDNNLLGYPSILEDPLPGALTTIQDTYTRVRTYNGTDWIEFNLSGGNLGGLSNLTPTEGYWITTTASDVWEVRYNSS